jgi:hypothetical protein
LHHASAPSTILMGGDAAKESALLAEHHLHSGREPLRAIAGTTLGGRYRVRASTGEFRGNAFRSAEGSAGAGGKFGALLGLNVSHGGGGSGATIMAHGQGGGGSHAGGYAGGSVVGSSGGGSVSSSTASVSSSASAGHSSAGGSVSSGGAAGGGHH